MRFSANLGYLWRELPLPDAIRAAAHAGFAAVEFHTPFDTPASDVKAALDETGLPLLSLNTERGAGPQELGLAALPGRDLEARTAIDQALAYAVAVGARAVHVLAGNSSGRAAHAAYVGNLRHAVQHAEALGITVLMEPLNRHDAPEYFLRTTDQARGITDEIGSTHLKLLFDCYHVARTEGDVTTRLTDLLPLIGHIQFAGVPDRGLPDRGEVDYQYVFGVLRDLGWSTPLGAEFRVAGPTEDSLGWMSTLA